MSVILSNEKCTENKIKFLKSVISRNKEANLNTYIVLTKPHNNYVNGDFLHYAF